VNLTRDILSKTITTGWVIDLAGAPSEFTA
jgi:hypothetical protein